MKFLFTTRRFLRWPALDYIVALLSFLHPPSLASCWLVEIGKVVVHLGNGGVEEKSSVSNAGQRK